MKAFGSERALVDFVKRRTAAQKRAAPAPVYDMAVPAPAAVAPPPPSAAPEAADVVVTGTRVQPALQDSSVAVNITNRQDSEVDEGGIVKMHGRHLVVLRRGRLFTVEIGDKTLRPVDRINAFPPGTTGDGAWYDEMLIAGDRVIVVGYSYARGGTEINRFRIGTDGRLSYKDSYHLRSNDYYSSENYASRLIGNRLIFYTPLYLDRERVLDSLPGVRRWTGDPDRPFERVAPAARVYLPTPVRERRDADIGTLHSVTNCDLATTPLRCRATAVLGSDARNFYVSGSAVYVWISAAFDDRRGNRALLYRLPLDGTAPSAVQASGGPVDQFSFREDRRDGLLNVVLRSEGRGDGMWRSQVTEGDVALLRLPLSSFGDGSTLASRSAYRPLPRVTGWSFNNRFIGRHLLYSAGKLQERTGSADLFVVPLDGAPVTRLAVPHGIDRLDITGSDGIAIGGGANNALGFTSVALGLRPSIADTSFLPAASEGESRSHAFFYRPDNADGTDGILGLPVTRELRPSFRTFLGRGSAVAFIERRARKLRPVGELAANAKDARDDGCQASCVDWYGNARPIFLGSRVFALMGYELVEGRQGSDGRIVEVERTNFSPPATR